MWMEYEVILMISENDCSILKVTKFGLQEML